MKFTISSSKLKNPTNDISLTQIKELIRDWRKNGGKVTAQARKGNANFFGRPNYYFETSPDLKGRSQSFNLYVRKEN